MDILEYFEEEFSKIQKASGSLTALYLQIKDLHDSLECSYKKVIELKSHFVDTLDVELDLALPLSDSLESLLKDYKHFVSDLEIATSALSSLKEN